MDKRLSKIIALAYIAIAIVLSSCSRENEDPVLAHPVISGLEIGIGNTHTSYIGSDIHIEAEIEAQGKINMVEVEVFKENGTGWNIKETFPEFSGQLNTNFHKHIDVPAIADPGTYIFRMKVTDMKGKSTIVNETLELIILEDNISPLINITNAPETGKTFQTGENISISGVASDNIALGNILVALVRQEDQIPDSDISATHPKVIVMADIRDFSSLEIQDFNANIKVGVAQDNAWNPNSIQGENGWKSTSYYMVVKTRDASQNFSYSPHYPIKINL